MVLLQDFEYAEVSETACKSATERQADPRLTRVEVGRIVAKLIHSAKSLPQQLREANGTHVGKVRYRGTCSSNAPKLLP